jgi:hypothetical protein
VARQKDVIGDREFESTSRQWYRTIGTGRYRFRSTHRADGSAVCTVDVAVAYGKWAQVHAFRKPAQG